jgi:hypothetical protein
MSIFPDLFFLVLVGGMLVPANIIGLVFLVVVSRNTHDSI